MKGKKADNPIAITLLVFIAVTLVAMALFVFNSESNRASVEIGNPEYLNGAYIDENQINFYIDNAVMRAASLPYNQKDEPILKKEFLNNLIVELKKDYSSDSDVLKNIASGLNENSIKLDGDNVTVSVRVSLKEDYSKIRVSYVYDKTFTRQLCYCKEGQVCQCNLNS